MTTQKCSADGKKHSTLPSFALGMLRRKWPQLLVYFLVMFFSMTVPVMLTVSSSEISSLRYVGREYWASEISRLTEALQDIGRLSAFFAAALALFAGCSAMRYLTNRSKAGFMHSLPFRRQTIFALETASSYLTLVLAYAAALLLALCSVTVGGFAGSGISAGLWRGALYALYFGFCFFAVSVFSGSVTGSSVVQCLLSLAILVIAPATYYGVYGFFETFHGEILWCEYYLSGTLLLSSSPLTSLFLLWTDGLGTLTVVLTLVGAVLFLVAALFCHRFRKTERSAMPVAYDAVGALVKYLCAFPVTIFFGLFFYLIGGSRYGWLLFGFACGALLWTMLVNTIVTRSPRQMFRGWRGLCVFLVLFSAFVVICGFDCFGVVRRAPAAAECGMVEIEMSGKCYQLTEQETADLAAVLDRGVRADTHGDMPRERYGVLLALHRGGHVSAIRRYYSGEDYQVICNAVRDSENFLDGFLPPFSQPKHMGYEGALMENGVILNDGYDELNAEDAIAFRTCYARDWEAHRDKIGKMPVTGTVSVQSEQGYQHYPLFACFTETNAFLQRVAKPYSDGAVSITEENWSEMVSCVESVMVIIEKWDIVDSSEVAETADWYTLEEALALGYTEEDYMAGVIPPKEEPDSDCRTFTDPEEIRQILSALTAIPGCDSVYYTTLVTPVDDRVRVIVTYRTSYGIASDSTWFLKGETPAFVIAAFEN